MKLKKAILELEQNIKPYLPFLNDWIKHKHCSLNEDEISVINFHAKNNFKLNVLQYFNASNKIEVVKRIVAKLIWDYRKFKHWIITNFVFRLVKIAKQNHFNDLLLHLPLNNISIPYNLKITFNKMNIKTFYQFFELYKAKDLYEEKNFKKILDFETEIKHINI